MKTSKDVDAVPNKQLAHLIELSPLTAPPSISHPGSSYAHFTFDEFHLAQHSLAQGIVKKMGPEINWDEGYLVSSRQRALLGANGEYIVSTL